jgi:hypothetical protein
MKLLVTFSIFLCSLFVREPVFVNASAVAGNWMTTSTNDSSNAKEKSVSALQINFGLDEISLFDDDDDDDDNEFSVSRKKIQLLRSFNNSIELLLMQQTHKSVFNPGFDYNTYFLAGTKKCIFQRVIRV